MFPLFYIYMNSIFEFLIFSQFPDPRKINQNMMKIDDPTEKGHPISDHFSQTHNPISIFRLGLMMALEIKAGAYILTQLLFLHTVFGRYNIFKIISKH